MLLLVNSVHGKTSQKVKTDNVRAICRLHLCYNFALVLQENALLFSQSEAHNFFMYIVTAINYRLTDQTLAI